MLLPLVVVITAPVILNIFGHGTRYTVKGFFDGGAASGIFYCLNYVSDIVLLAREKVVAYVIVNCAGTGAVLLSVIAAVNHGLGALGLAWFLGQACYCFISCLALTWYVGRRNLLSVIRY